MDCIKPKSKMIRQIEELSFNAWPALQTLMFDGWVIRFANGYSQRANSINPIYDSTIDIEEKIRFCEQIYRDRNLPVVFKITSAVHPENLDAVLKASGYQTDSRTSVQMLESINKHSIQGVELNESFTEEWLDGLCRLNNINEERQLTLRQMLGNIVPQKCFAAIRQHGQGIAYGFGVLQNEYVGLFDVVTDASFRNQGYGRRLVSGLLTWGKQNHARKAYLQVMLNNPPALHLYSKLGFQEAYQYWYRKKR
jgi:N-acetylglutamate synthase